jgi:hypothetical protein
LNAHVIKRTLPIAGAFCLVALLVAAWIVVLARYGTNPIGLVGGILLAVGLVALIRKIDALALLRALEGMRLFLPIVAFQLASWSVGRFSGTEVFNEVAAQVIPVFLLALALEARFFHLHRVKEPLDLGAMLFTLVLLGIGEFYALQAVATERPDHTDMVSGALAAGFVAIAIAALIGPGLKPREERAQREELPGST